MKVLVLLFDAGCFKVGAREGTSEGKRDIFID